MPDTQNYPLTQYSHGAGCGCKISPQVLDIILHTNTTAPDNKNLLVGNSSKDDAAVYDLGDGNAIISTTDFFMPIVDDPFDFGRIASANAISDVYAMGGRPMMAIAILGWPIDKIPPEVAQRVIEGSRSICAEAGIPLAGGHSIDSPEPIFGLSVNGMVPIGSLKRNSTAREGDLLFLTKPLGIGILSTAQKRNVLEPADMQTMLRQLTQLNKVGHQLGAIEGVHAMTDVTGFGLLGHLVEMCEGSDTGAELWYDKIPFMPAAKRYLAQKTIPGGTVRNWNSYGHKVFFNNELNTEEAKNILADPQTNGGLLIAVREDAREEVENLLFSLQLHNVLIGKMIKMKGQRITVIPGT
jgi:selenide,water dikinase